MYPGFTTIEKKNKSKDKKVRSLKVQPQHRNNRWTHNTVPEIRLRGAWLEKLGFSPYQRISVTTDKKTLVIRVEE